MRQPGMSQPAWRRWLSWPWAARVAALLLPLLALAALLAPEVGAEGIDAS